MKVTDGHCHLDFQAFHQSLPSLLQQCHDKHIHRIIVPSVTPERWQSVLSLTEQLKAKVNIACGLGIHPWFLIPGNELSAENIDLDFQTKQLKKTLKIALDNNHQQVIAIGECGIDVFKAKKNTHNEQAFAINIELQQQCFEMQLQLAQEHNLPVIVHHCQSHQYIVPLLKKYNVSKGGVIHAFSGNYQQAKAYLDLGYKLGIGGTITYPRAKKTINAVKRLPLASLVIETDAPAMPALGQQGMNNSPLNLLIVFQALVAIRAESSDVVAQQLELNVDQLFFADERKLGAR